MAEPISGIGPKIDISKWKKLTVQEILKEQNQGQEVPAEIVAWAQQMAAFANVPDDVTYEDVGGDTGIEALNRLGMENPEGIENATAPTETEEPDAIKDTALAEETDNESENPFANNLIEEEDNITQEEEKPEEIDVTLADRAITADDDTIRRRKARRGLE